MDIQKLNCISPGDPMHPIRRVDPDYPLYIKVFYTDADEIIIAGMYAYEGVYWLSVTDANDTETLRTVFEYVKTLKPAECANIHQVIGHTRYTDEQLRLFYYCKPETADEMLAYGRKIKESFRMKGPGGKYAAIQKYNCLTPENASRPKYMPNPRDRLIKVYYADRGKVIITGFADNNFIYWLSVTKAENISRNRMIFDYLTETVPTIFGSVGYVLPKTGYSYEQFREFYCAELKSADEITAHYQQTKERSKAQESEQNIKEIMMQHMRTLRVRSGDEIDDYHKHEALIKKIQAQTHLRCSDDPEVVRLYNELYQLCSDIYNAYMTAAH